MDVQKPALFLLTGLALAAMPTAQAAFQVDVTPRDGVQVAPEVESGQVVVRAIADCEAVLRATGSEGATVTLAFSHSPFIVLDGPTTVQLSAQPCLQGATDVSVEMPFQVATTRQAPGLKAMNVQVNATLSAGGRGLFPPTAADTDFTVSAKPYFVDETVLPRRLAASQDGRATWDIAVHNLGNVRTQYNLAVLQSPAEGRILLPDIFILDSPNGGGEGKTSEVVSFRYERHGFWDQGAIRLLLTSKSADQPDFKGQSQEIDVLARNGNDVARALPSPALPLALAGLVGALVLRGRRA